MTVAKIFFIKTQAKEIKSHLDNVEYGIFLPNSWDALATNENSTWIITFMSIYIAFSLTPELSLEMSESQLKHQCYYIKSAYFCEDPCIVFICFRKSVILLVKKFDLMYVFTLVFSWISLICSFTVRVFLHFMIFIFMYSFQMSLQGILVVELGATHPTKTIFVRFKT